MKYCINCLQPDTRPNTKFSNEGLCPACIYFGELKKVDWQERYETLLKLVENTRRHKNHKFDCIIGVSGGKDSTRQALWIRDKLKLNPLLVCLSYPPEQLTERGADNISNLINLGFDLVISAPAPETWRILVRESFLKFTNWAKSTELALFSSVPQLALRYQIPLILWGENPGLQLGDLKTLGRTGYDGNNLRNMNTLNGGSAEWIANSANKNSSLVPYQYPSVVDFSQGDLQIVYLGWFLKDWSLVNNGAHSITNGLKVREDTVENTGDLYGITSLDEDWVTLNQMIKYYKFGFGRVTDYVNEGIRHGDMTRLKGTELVSNYDHACSNEYIESFCDYIKISQTEFWGKVYDSVNPKLFNINPNGTIEPKFKVGIGI